MRKIFSIFVVWRIWLFVVLFLSLSLVKLQGDFLGGGLSNYLAKPGLWAWANFDGEHYLLIARSGYQSLTYFFFPLYPVLIRQISVFLPGNFYSYLYSGLLVSNVSFLFALAGIYKLIRLDNDRKTAYSAIILLVLFPTSFYFGSVYTESLFLALTVWSFLSARRGNWYLSGILGGLASATRITGLALLPALLIEYYIQNKDALIKKISANDIRNLFSVCLVSGGLLGYMLFLWKNTGDPLAFFHNLNQVFGEQRATKLILLPQVFYRYIFKVLPAVNYSYFPAAFTAWLEFITGSLFLILSVISLFKTRLSYSFYSICAYLIPTLSGSFSSFPRYVVIIFPLFLLSAQLLERTSPAFKNTVYILLFISGLMAEALFLRGYWVS